MGFHDFGRVRPASTLMAAEAAKVMTLLYSAQYILGGNLLRSAPWRAQPLPQPGAQQLLRGDRRPTGVRLQESNLGRQLLEDYVHPPRKGRKGWSGGTRAFGGRSLNMAACRCRFHAGVVLRLRGLKGSIPLHRRSLHARDQQSSFSAAG
jgi:hypothetical protein